MTNGKLTDFDCKLLAKHRRKVLPQLGSQLAYPQSALRAHLDSFGSRAQTSSLSTTCHPFSS